MGRGRSCGSASLSTDSVALLTVQGAGNSFPRDESLVAKRSTGERERREDRAKQASMKTRLFADHRSRGIQRPTISPTCCRNQARLATITMAIATSSRDVGR